MEGTWAREEMHGDAAFRSLPGVDVSRPETKRWLILGGACIIWAHSIGTHYALYFLWWPDLPYRVDPHFTGSEHGIMFVLRSSALPESLIRPRQAKPLIPV